MAIKTENVLDTGFSNTLIPGELLEGLMVFQISNDCLYHSCVYHVHCDFLDAGAGDDELKTSGGVGYGDKAGAIALGVDNTRSNHFYARLFLEHTDYLVGSLRESSM